MEVEKSEKKIERREMTSRWVGGVPALKGKPSSQFSEARNEVCRFFMAVASTLSSYLMRPYSNANGVEVLLLLSTCEESAADVNR